MTKSDLLRHIAQTGYNIGYAAKKHFATYDLASKTPGTISFLTLCVGLAFLLVDFAAKKYFSAACIALGVLGLRISMWDHKKEDYAKTGVDLTNLFNRAKELYFQVKAQNGIDLSAYESSLQSLQDEYNKMGLSNQIMFSDWYAHYKFFWQQQIDWIDEQLHFRFWRDRVPLSLSVAIGLFVVGAIGLSAVLYFR